MNRLAALVVAGALASTAPAKAFDFAPGDYVPLPAGTTIFAGYLQGARSTEFRLDGVGSVPDSKLGTVVGIARFVHYTSLAGRAAEFQVIAPFGRINSAKIGGTDLPVDDGIADVTVAAGYWPVVADPANPYGTTIGGTFYVTLPTGAYDFGKVSLGSGTTTFTPQIGLVQGLGPKLFLDAGIDAAFALDHREQGVQVSRDPVYSFQAYLRYQPELTTNLSIGYAGATGGKLDFDGSASGQKVRYDQVRLFANTMISPTVQIQGMLGADLNVEGGFKQHPIVQLRLVKVF